MNRVEGAQVPRADPLSGDTKRLIQGDAREPLEYRVRITRRTCRT